MKTKLLVAAVGAALLATGAAEARIVRVEMDAARSQSPTFEGRSFGSVGQYEKLRGIAYGELDPSDAHNAVITDIERAPRNARGMVEYSMDVFILKPIDYARGNKRLFVDHNNRGGMRVGLLNGVPANNNPTSAADAGTGFVYERGYTITSNGWDVGAEGFEDIKISVPNAYLPGQLVTGPSYEYIVFDNATTTASPLTYPAATLDQSAARLTRRQFLDDAPTDVPASGWTYNADGTSISLTTGAFQRSWIYEFTYTAKDPVVTGVGLAATRDWISFLRNASKDDAGTPNPLRGAVQRVYTYSISQPSRTLNDHVYYGFNEDENGKQVVDGILSHTGAGNGDGINYRFGQPGRTERNRQNHLYPESPFPFAHQTTADPLTGRVDGRDARCTATRTCPRRIEVNSANEYWVKAGSLLHTDALGNDLPQPANTRYYLVSGTSHGVGNVLSKSTCQQFLNPTIPYTLHRALLDAMDAWITHGREPPASRIPRRSDGTAALAATRPGFQTGRVAQADLGWPNIPGVTFNGLITTRYFLDFGPRFSDGIIDNYPPTVAGRPSYTIFVSKVDADGNEIAGVRLPPVAAPIATTTGWGLRSAGNGLNDGCEANGQHIAFEKTLAARMAKGDPRLSLEERYGDKAGYVAAVTAAARALQAQGYLLEADVQLYIGEANASTAFNP
jgi:hypothetical protein